MKVLVIGSGGREHCLIWKIAQSDRVKQIYCAPGNGGTEALAGNVHISADDIQGLSDFAQEKRIDLTVVGPEVPLVKGIVDEFQGRGLKIFGPHRELALLEGSKVFAKKLMDRFSLPSADFRIFSNESEAVDYIRKKDMPVVVKADGLAAGKGVYVCRDRTQAEQALKEIMAEKRFGVSGETVVIEDCLQGEEASILLFSDGRNMLSLASSQDHKRIYEGDRGPNTGGMGAYSPAPVFTDEQKELLNKRIVHPLLEGLNKEEKRYTGILYLGLMLTSSGPKILEFNVRFGDPETQAILPRLKNDLIEVIFAAIEGRLHKISLVWDSRPCVCVVIASGGYPQSYEKGKEISGLPKAETLPDTFIFHAGTKKKDGKYFTAGGRVLNISSLGADLEQARNRAYQAIEKIAFEKMYFRRDIGWRALKKEG